MSDMKSLENINDWLDVQEHQKIGEILMQSGKLSLSDLGVALDVQKFEPVLLGDILIKMQVITNQELEMALKLQKQLDDIIEKRGI